MVARVGYDSWPKCLSLFKFKIDACEYTFLDKQLKTLFFRDNVLNLRFDIPFSAWYSFVETT